MIGISSVLYLNPFLSPKFVGDEKVGITFIDRGKRNYFDLVDEKSIQ